MNPLGGGFTEPLFFMPWRKMRCKINKFYQDEQIMMC